MKEFGHLYLVPTVITENSLDTIPERTVQMMHSLDHFIVERSRTARRYLSASGFPKPIRELHILEFEKDGRENISSAISWLEEGKNVGIISESGLPAVADPGSVLVDEAHARNIRVIALPGPSSIPSAIAASGLNGQYFTFHGYLPIKENELRKALKRMEQIILSHRSTQIFIETPYRNDRLYKHIVNSLQPHIKLCVASDIFGSGENIRTLPIAQWKKQKSFTIGKTPTVFLLGL